MQTLTPAQACEFLANSTPSFMPIISGAPVTHLITDLLEDTGEEFPYHQFPREVLVLRATTRAQGL